MGRWCFGVLVGVVVLGVVVEVVETRKNNGVLFNPGGKNTSWW